MNLGEHTVPPDRPMLVASAAAAVLLAATLILLSFLIISDHRQTEESRVALRQVTGQLAPIQREQAKIDAAMRQAGNEVVLDRSILFNTLIKRKAISWTRIFGDLEKVLPRDVRADLDSPAGERAGSAFSGYDSGGRCAGAGDRFYHTAGRIRRFRVDRGQRLHTTDPDRSFLALPPHGELCPETLTSRCRASACRASA